MKRYLLAIGGLALLCPQLAFSQPYDPNYGRRGAYNDRPYTSGYARDSRDCQSDQQNKQMTNAAIGAAAGGCWATRSQAAAAATGGTIAGVLLGAVAGYALTHDVDCNDRNYAEPTYSRGLEGPVGQRYGWRNDNDRDYGNFTPTREYQRDNYTCRDYNASTWRHGPPHAPQRLRLPL